jgi:hypothetical protein
VSGLHRSQYPNSRMNRLSAFLVVLGVGATVAGCASMGSALTGLNNSILRPEHVRGTYELVRLSDSDLPLRTQLNETVECSGGGISATAEVREGRLSLSSDGPSLSGGRRLLLSYDSATAEIHSADMGGLWRRPAVNVASPERGGAAGFATATVATEYQLRLVNGDPLPVALNPLRGCDRRLTGGTLVLAEHGNFRLQAMISETWPGSSSASVLTYEGTFEQSGDYINFVEPGRLGNFRGVLRGLEIDLPLGSLRLSFLAGSYTPVDPTEALFAEVQQRVQSYRPDHAYDCSQDPLLAGAPPIAVRDTAGLGARISAGFPEFHLSTEREIACRFPYLDGSTPHTFVPEFGSGRAWWVQVADIDEDGRDDIITVLTSDANADDDRLVVLFGNGGAAEVGRLGGWGFAVGERAGRPAVSLVIWDKTSEVYHWNGQEFVSWEDPNECCE